MSPASHARDSQPAARLAVLREIEDAARRCRQPIRLRGRLTECDPATGEIIATLDSSDRDGGCIEIPCGNRREAICPSCAWLYKGDTYQVMIAGLRGGHGIPETVADHPAVFATLTAPSFGPVHRGPAKPGQEPPRCRPRRGRPLCQHGKPASCGRRHEPADILIGQPLCSECFDYHAAVLFNAAVPALWNQTAQALPSVLARELAISRRQLRDSMRLSFGKVIEYQHRGLIHVHAVIRTDGPQGPGDAPPAWADARLLRDAVTAAAAIPSVTLPDPRTAGTLALRWGDQLDVRPVRRGIGGELDYAKVAAYIAKYASKGTEDCGGIPRPIRSAADLDDYHVTPHARKLITACWQLGQRDEYKPLHLAKWAHQLGYRGHFSTRSRRYSVTLGSRREERRATRTAWTRQQQGLPATPGIITSDWHYAGTG